MASLEADLERERNAADEARVEQVSASKRIEAALNAVLTFATVVLAVSVGYQVFFDPGDRARVGTPVKVSDWRPHDTVGVRFGPRTAAVNLVVISDPECPVCRSFNSVSSLARARFGASLAVTHVLIPLEYHKNAVPAILASECTRSDAEFQSWMDAVYAQQELLGKVSWGAIARSAGIPDTTAIVACANAPRSSSRRLPAAMAYSQRMESEGTPTVIINGWRLPHPPTGALLDALVEALLRNEDPFRRRTWAKLVEATRLG